MSVRLPAVSRGLASSWAEEGVSTAVRHPIALDDGGDAMGLELSGNAITGRSVEVNVLEQRSELACGMAGQQHEHTCARAAGANPVAYRTLG